MIGHPQCPRDSQLRPSIIASSFTVFLEFYYCVISKDEDVKISEDLCGMHKKVEYKRKKYSSMLGTHSLTHEPFLSGAACDATLHAEVTVMRNVHACPNTRSLSKLCGHCAGEFLHEFALWKHTSCEVVRTR